MIYYTSFILFLVIVVQATGLIYGLDIFKEFYFYTFIYNKMLKDKNYIYYKILPKNDDDAVDNIFVSSLGYSLYWMQDSGVGIFVSLTDKLDRQDIGRSKLFGSYSCFNFVLPRLFDKNLEKCYKLKDYILSLDNTERVII